MLQEPQAVVDVGAGLRERYGAWLRRYPSMVIHAIDANPDVAAALRLRYASLGPRLQVYSFAATATDEPRETVLHVANDGSSSSTKPFVPQNVRRWRYPAGRRVFRTVETRVVPTRTLHAFLRENGIRHVTLLNVDTQGDAFDVLRGLQEHATWQRIRELTVKVHTIDYDLYEGQSRADQVIDLCRRHYFHVVDRRTRTRGQEDVLAMRSDLSDLRGERYTAHNGLARRVLAP